MNPWQTLGVTTDIAVADLRRRYAALIKEFRPETHPQEFARIREAYEIVLRFARQRAAAELDEQTPPARETADNAADATTAPAPEVAAATILVEDEIEAELAIDAEAISAVLAQSAGTADEPSLADLFRHFHRLAESAVGTRDEALLPALRTLLRARTRASLDDSQALEFALLRWFLEAEMPALTLLFEAGRAFDWHGHESRLSSWLSPHALTRIEGLLSLSCDLVFARHFSGNAWLRRLHATRPSRALLAWRPAALDAQGWAARWQATSEGVAMNLAACLEARALAQVNGRTLMSTDVLLGLAAMSTAPAWGAAAVAGLVVATGSFGVRRGLGALQRAPANHWSHTAWVVGRVVTVLLAVVGLFMILNSTPNLPTVGIGIALVLPASLFVPALAWRALAQVEGLVALGFSWSADIDRLEFDRMRSAGVITGDQPFGPRLTGLARLKAIAEARRLEKVEVARGQRPARPALFDHRRWGRFQGTPRMVWYGLWIVFALLRVAHLIGAN
jgi:hypothetical protein